MLVFIIDDERIVRLGLRSMLEELWGLQDEKLIIMEATNGRDLCDLCQDHSPDLALVDIRMPVIDGLTAIEMCQKYSQDTMWVLLTGISDFDYAVKAVKLGVKDYLLKPIGAEEIAELLKKACGNRQTKQSEQNTLFSVHAISYLNAISASLRVHEEPFLSLQKDQLYFAAVFIEDGYDIEIKQKRQSVEIISAIKKYLQPKMQLGFQYTDSYIYTGEACLIIRGPLWGCVHDIVHCIEAEINRMINGKPVVTVYMCTSSISILDIVQTIKYICEHSELRVIAGIGSVYDSESLLSLCKNASLAALANQVIRLCDSYQEKNESAYNNCIQGICKALSSIQTNSMICNIMRFIHVKTAITFPSATLPGFQKTLENSITAMYEQMSTKPPSDTVSEIEQYIQDNYMNDIGIASIADAFNLSPAYVSRIFHKNTNEKYIDYLTKIRMQHAKRILSENSNITIKSVAMMVGYYSSRYFSKLFLSVAGIYPSEYREQIKQSHYQRNKGS